MIAFVLGRRDEHESYLSAEQARGALDRARVTSLRKQVFQVSRVIQESLPFVARTTCHHFVQRATTSKGAAFAEFAIYKTVIPVIVTVDHAP